MQQQIDSLMAQNADLFNRLLAQDWTQYVALSNEPQPPPPAREVIWDPTGLIEVDKTDDE